MKNLWVVIPVKGFDKSKLRLAPLLKAQEREQLSKAMFLDLLKALKAADGIHTILVVSSHGDVIELANHCGVSVLNEGADCAGLNDAVRLGLTFAESKGAEQVLICHADLPLFESAHISQIVAAHPLHDVTIIPDKHRMGTNVMMLNVPSQMQIFYGENSFNLHKAFCTEKNLALKVLDIEALALDVDQPEDVNVLVSYLSANQQSATYQSLNQFSCLNALFTESVS